MANLGHDLAIVTEENLLAYQNWGRWPGSVAADPKLGGGLGGREREGNK